MRRIRFALMVACAMGAAACDDDETGPDGRSEVTLSVAIGPEAAPGISLDETITVGDDVLVLQSVQIVLREIEFERSESSIDCDEVEGDDDECEEIEVGPILLDVPLGTGIARELAVVVDTGHFDELEFEIHKPEDDGDAADVAFIAEHPEFEDVSIRVTGTFNDVPFTYETDLNVEQEHELSPPLIVAESGSVNVTLLVDVSTWFLDAAGTALVDPATANSGGVNEGLVEDNIEQSIQAFEDDDSDGAED